MGLTPRGPDDGCGAVVPVMVTTAESFTVVPFQWAWTSTVTEPAEAPAEKTVDGPVTFERPPKVLLVVQSNTTPEGQLPLEQEGVATKSTEPPTATVGWVGDKATDWRSTGEDFDWMVIDVFAWRVSPPRLAVSWTTSKPAVFAARNTVEVPVEFESEPREGVCCAHW